jgi:hypothetical protein
MKELSVEKYFVNKIAEAFPTAEVRKYECQMHDPDRILLLPGNRCVFVEVKRPGKDLRPGQERAFRRLHNLGFEAYVANTKEKVDLLIRHLKIGYNV